MSQAQLIYLDKERMKQGNASFDDPNDNSNIRDLDGSPIGVYNRSTTGREHDNVSPNAYNLSTEYKTNEYVEEQKNETMF